MPLLVGVPLSHVEDDKFLRARPAPGLQLRERHEGDVGSGFRQHLCDGLAAAHVGAQGLGNVGRHLEIEIAHHLHEGAAIAHLQARVLGELLTYRGMLASLVLVRRVDLGGRLEEQQPLEEAFVQRSRVAAWQVRAAGRSDEQGITGEYPVVDPKAHGVARVARCVQNLQAKLSNGQHLPVIQREGHEGRRAEPMHRDRYLELSRQLLRCREMIRVRMGVDHITDPQTIARGECQISVDERDFRIDQRRCAALGAPDEIGPATAVAELLENHRSTPNPTPSGAARSPPGRAACCTRWKHNSAAPSCARCSKLVSTRAQMRLERFAFAAPGSGKFRTMLPRSVTDKTHRPLNRYSAWALLRASFARAGYWKPLWSGARLKDSYEVIVVGGGGHGLAIAYHLARDHRIGRVAVLEKRLVGYGNVGRNTTVVRSNYLLPENHYFYEDSLRRWERLSKDLNYNVMYSPRGVVDLATSDREMASLVQRGNAMRLAGIDAELLDGKGLGRFVPELDLRAPRRFQIVGALLQRRGGTVRHDAVAWGYARAASALGVDIIENCEVTGVRTAAGAAVGVETTQGFVGAERIVFAVAGHTAAIGSLLGRRLPLETHILQAMVTEPIKPLLNTVVIYMYPHAETYISQSDRGGLVMGGMLDGFPSYTRQGQWSRIEEVVQGTVALLPQTAGLRLLRYWAGINDMTMDGSPIMDRLAYDNVFVNGGWCYGGFKAIPASGAAFARFVATGTAPDLIRPFGLSRFGTGHVLDERGAGPFPARQ